MGTKLKICYVYFGDQICGPPQRLEIQLFGPLGQNVVLDFSILFKSGVGQSYYGRNFNRNRFFGSISVIPQKIFRHVGRLPRVIVYNLHKKLKIGSCRRKSNVEDKQEISSANEE